MVPNAAPVLNQIKNNHLEGKREEGNKNGLKRSVAIGNDQIRRGRRSSVNVIFSPSVSGWSRMMCKMFAIKTRFMQWIIISGRGHGGVCVCVLLRNAELKYVLHVCYTFTY